MKGARFAALALILSACAPRAVQDEQDGIQLIEWNNGSAVSLDGPWEFYWDRLLLPADFARTGQTPDHVQKEMRAWNNLLVNGKELPGPGMATYRMRISLKGGSGRAGLYFQHQMSAMRVFVNGELKSETGKIGPRLEDTIGARQATAVFFDVEPTNEVIVHIANVDHFLGGMRGLLVLGAEEAVRRYAIQRLAAEILILGFVLGAAVYHLGFYLFYRSQKSFLLFSMVCFSICLRIPFLGTKAYSMFLDPVSWSTQLRVLALVNAWSIPLGIYYFRSLFPDFLSSGAARVYLIAAGIFSLFQFSSMQILSAANLVYTTAGLFAIVLHSLVVLGRAFKAQRSAALMVLGMGALGLLSGLSLLQNWRGLDGGAYGLVSFFLFVLFHALALSRFFQAAIRAEAGLTERLRQSKQALVRQREQLQVNLHDSLGGALTDLQVHTEQRMRSSESGASEALGAIHDRISEAVRMFRSQLLFMEDLDMTAQDLLPGIQMTLLRRYADAGREIDFEVSPDAAAKIETQGESLVPVDGALDLFFLVTELCTNDLKYGQGESFWRIALEGEDLVIAQRNGMRSSMRPVRVPQRAAERVRNLRGTLRAEALDGEFAVEVRIPLSR